MVERKDTQVQNDNLTWIPTDITAFLLGRCLLLPFLTMSFICYRPDVGMTHLRKSPKITKQKIQAILPEFCSIDSEHMQLAPDSSLICTVELISAQRGISLPRRPSGLTHCAISLDLTPQGTCIATATQLIFIARHLPEERKVQDNMYHVLRRTTNC